MSFLSFTQAEKRALVTLAVFLGVGMAVHVLKGQRGAHAPGYRLIATAPVASPVPRPETQDRLAQGISPNTALQEDLELLPGIGPGLALRIIRHRESHGPYRSASDLLAVPGIGERLLARITPYLSFP